MKAERAKLLTMPKLAVRLRVSRRQAYRLVRQMPNTTNERGHLRVSDADVEKFIADHTKPPVPR